MEQLVFAFEKASVAAAKRDTSVVVAAFDVSAVASAGTPVLSSILTRLSSPLMLGTR